MTTSPASSDAASENLMDHVPPVGNPRTEDAPTLRVFLIHRGHEQGVHVAKRNTLERWSNIFQNLPVNMRFQVTHVSASELLPALSSVAADVLIVDGASVMDPMSVEIAIQAEATSGVSNMQSQKRGEAPLLRVTPKAAKLLSAGSEPSASLGTWAEDAGCTLSKQVVTQGFWMHVDLHEHGPKAEWGLLKELQLRPGGLVAKYLNRPISLQITRPLVNTSITPNQTTWVAFAIGLVAIPLFLMATWEAAVAAAILLQVNSILDGVDGELARIRQTQSTYGAYLDSVVDEILTMAYLIALGYHLKAIGAGDYYLYLGIVGGLGFFTYACVHWHCKWKHGLGLYWWWDAYKPRKEVQRSNSAYSYLKKLFAKESIQFIIIFAALFQFMEEFSFAFGVAGAGIFVLLFIHIVIVRARW